MTTTTYASASYDDKDGDSSLEEVSGSNGKQWKLNAVFDKAEIGVEVMITLGDDGSINYNIPYDGISGKGIKKLSSISITPFLGASGGVQTVYNEKEKDWIPPFGTVLCMSFLSVFIFADRCGRCIFL